MDTMLHHLIASKKQEQPGDQEDESDGLPCPPYRLLPPHQWHAAKAGGYARPGAASTSAPGRGRGRARGVRLVEEQRRRVAAAEVHGRPGGGRRRRDEARGEVEVPRVVVVALGPAAAAVEVERVAERVVAELPAAGPVARAAAAEPEPADEGLPPRAGHQLRPLPRLHQRVHPAPPPPAAARRRPAAPAPDAVPPLLARRLRAARARGRGRRGGRRPRWRPEAAAAAVPAPGEEGGVRLVGAATAPAGGVHGD
ncbi:hypothetical protein PVAP13_4KG200203 [Panicum virgatum]|uniref:Uncharacterized protein n=1 Tax=Panicum virgatum TaxID=38727 RepID=A0A8T0TK39_PANVG|nr:hypothetical protein PVAP13_4KG200203 [Panicum virgatum]